MPDAAPRLRGIGTDLADHRAVLRLRNHPDNRCWFTLSTRKTILLEHHLAWWAGKQRQTHFWMFVVESGPDIIGTFTLEAVGGGDIEVARMAIDPDRKSRGIGSGLIRFAVGRARELQAFRRVVAETMVDNIAGQRIVEKAGFSQVALVHRAGFALKAYALDLHGEEDRPGPA